VKHCGHPTANTPYTITTPDGLQVIAYNRHGFRHVSEAMTAVEMLYLGVAKIEDDRGANCLNQVIPLPRNRRGAR